MAPLSPPSSGLSVVVVVVDVDVVPEPSVDVDVSTCRQSLPPSSTKAQVPLGNNQDSALTSDSQLSCPNYFS
jgi:hypothetical protein